MVDWEAFYAAFRSPDFIPGYEIQNHLGGGAFGEVYRARKRSIGKAYAIKFLRLGDGADGEATPGSAEHELEQVRLFASIDHPHLVTIEDMGVALGVPYLVMGYAGEDTLARRLARGELDPEQAVRFFVQACRGVLALHDRRLAHFDLKPSNVFLRGEVARVGDYGLAKLLEDGRQTLSVGRGTPQYMAPEMLRKRADHRADIYSLGVILFESLTGRLPFAGADDASAGGTVVLREDDDPPRFPPGFPPQLERVVTRCLRLEPDARYDSVHALLAELGQTARQGDSIRVRYGELSDELRELQRQGFAGRSPAAPRSADGPRAAPPPGPAPPPPSAVRPTPVEERALDQRGVSRRRRGDAPDGEPADLAGLPQANRDARSPGAPLTAASSPPAPPSDGSDVVAVHALDEPDDAYAEVGEESRPASAALPGSAPDAPWRRELERSRRERSSGLAVPGAVPSGPGTIPVPPRAEGGWFGSVVQAVVVGGEIMGALVTGPVLMAVHATAGYLDRVLKGVPGVVGSGLRLLLTLVFLAALGGLVAGAVLAALALRP